MGLTNSSALVSLQPGVAPGILLSEEAPRKRLFSRIALVSMPWGSNRKPGLAIPILKVCAQKAGFTTQVYPLTIRFAEMIGLEEYEALSDQSLHPEWFFSQHVMGPAGSGEVRNSWQELTNNPEAGRFREAVLRGVKGSEQLLTKIADEYVPAFLDECVRRIPWDTFGVVGFTVTFAQTFASAALAKRIKELYPHVHIIFGGANVESEMGVEVLRAFPWIDHVVHGEGETVFPELLTSLANRESRKVISVSSRIDGELLRGDGDHPPFVDLNQAPIPDFTDFTKALRESPINRGVWLQLPFESSRGCWWGQKHHCTFCGLNSNGMAHRKKEANRVFEEILELTSTNNCLNLFAADNILPLEYLQKLLPRIVEADLDLNVFYETKANLNKAQLELLAKAGVLRIQPGIESFNTKLLAHMQKGITAIQNIQFIKWCWELGIMANYNLLYGFPGEDPAYYAPYPALFRSLQHLEPPGYLIRVVYQRFSPYHFRKDQYGLELQADAAYRYLYPSDRVSLDQVAYFFQEPEGRAPDVSYINPVMDAFQTWNNVWKKVAFTYNKGPGYVVLYDTRQLSGDAPADTGSAAAYRQYTIPEPGASMYLFCDQHRSLSAICKMVKEKFAGRYTDNQVEVVLKKFVSRHFMFEEDGKYLALAVRSPRTRSRSSGMDLQSRTY